MIKLLSTLTLQFLSPGYGPNAKKSLSACICLTVNASQPQQMFPNNETKYFQIHHEYLDNQLNNEIHISDKCSVLSNHFVISLC